MRATGTKLDGGGIVSCHVRGVNSQQKIGLKSQRPAEAAGLNRLVPSASQQLSVILDNPITSSRLALSNSSRPQADFVRHALLIEDAGAEIEHTVLEKIRETDKAFGDFVDDVAPGWQRFTEDGFKNREQRRALIWELLEISPREAWDKAFVHSARTTMPSHRLPLDQYYDVSDADLKNLYGAYLVSSFFASRRASFQYGRKVSDFYLYNHFQCSTAAIVVSHLFAKLGLTIASESGAVGWSSLHLPEHITLAYRCEAGAIICFDNAKYLFPFAHYSNDYVGRAGCIRRRATEDLRPLHHAIEGIYLNSTLTFLKSRELRRSSDLPNRYIEALLKLNPKHTAGMCLSGENHINDDYLCAIDSLEEAIKSNPYVEWPYRILMELHHRSGEYDQVARIAEQADRHSIANWHITAIRVRSLIESHRLARAEIVLLASLERFSELALKGGFDASNLERFRIETVKLLREIAVRRRSFPVDPY